MTSEDLYHDLCEHGFPILAVGDHGQLPPIGTDFNLMKDPDTRLEKIHRQAENNPILRIAHLARNVGWLRTKDYTPTVRVLDQNSVPEDVGKLMLKGSKKNMVICGTNALRIAMNVSIMAQRGRDVRKDPAPQEGDRIICLRNDDTLGLFNGALGTVLRIDKDWGEHISAAVKFDHLDEPLLVTIALWAFNKVKPTHPAGPRVPGLPFDYGYCLTCHKAQGSEAHRVFVIGRGFGDSDMRKRWLYTAVTRAREELYVLQ